MAKQHLVHPILTPLAFAVVGGSVWYALHASHQLPSPASSVQASAATPKNTNASTQELGTVTPTVQQVAGQVSFSIDTKPYKHVQRVEFYVENRFVGVAYAPPYTVSVDQANMTSGSHTVVARVYMPSTVTETTPASFTNTQAASTPPPADADSDATTSAPIVSTPSPTTQLGAPPSVVAEANDNQSVDVSWTAATGATSYQIWRDGSQVGSGSSLAYHDSGLTAGQTYDYVIIAVDGSGNTAAADPVAVTLPTPPPDPQQQLTAAQPTGDANNPDSNQGT